MRTVRLICKSVQWMAIHSSPVIALDFRQQDIRYLTSGIAAVEDPMGDQRIDQQLSDVESGGAI